MHTLLPFTDNLHASSYDLMFVFLGMYSQGLHENPLQWMQLSVEK